MLAWRRGERDAVVPHVHVARIVEDDRFAAGRVPSLPIGGREDADALAIRIVEQDLNVREVEALVQALENPKERRRVRDKDADTRAFEKELADTLGLKVEIKRGSGESGTLLIKYGNFDQLEYIKQRIGQGQGPAE